MRRAVALVVVDPVLAPLPRLHEGDAGAAGRVVAVHHLDQGAGDVGPVAPVLRLVDMPAVGREPVVRRAVNHGRDRIVIDTEVVPVEDVGEIVEAEAVGRVLGLVSGAGGVPALALEGEHPDLPGPGALEREGLAGGRGRAVPRGAGVELDEEDLPLHLHVSREAAVAAEHQQILPGELALGGVRHLVAAIPRFLEAHPERFVECGERGVDERRCVPGHEHEAIAEALLWMADVPAHDARRGAWRRGRAPWSGCRPDAPTGGS